MTMERMRAAVFTEAGRPLQLEELIMPAPRAGEVLVKVAACGVCHSDLHVMRGELEFPAPAVLGHEIAGTVAALGAGVQGLVPGQRVAASFIMPCGTCPSCSVGRDDMCETFFQYNRLKGQLYDGDTRLFRADGTPVWMYSMGGLAEYAVVPATDVFVLPEELPLEGSAIVGCAISTAYGAVRHGADLRPGERVAVVATGGVGLNVIQWARVFGAAQIIALDVAEEKLELARAMGASDVVNVREDPVERVRALTGGRGVDVAFEALGSVQTFGLAVDLLRQGGRMVAVGLAPAGAAVSVDIQRLVRRGLRLQGSYGSRVRGDMPDILRMAARGLFDIRRSITAVYPLERVQEAYDDLRERRITGRAIVTMPGARAGTDGLVGL